MPTGTPLLEARGIGRRHREADSWLLREVSLAICPGERLALTGSTGSGKTVLLRSLAMLDVIEEGAVLWQGQRVAADAVPVYRSQAIYLTQRARLFDGTVEQNLRMPYSLTVHCHRAYARENIVAQLHRLERDERFLALDAANLSGGEIQIVAFLRAIQLDPTMLLLDEPTASLDERTAWQIEQLVTDWMSVPGVGRAFVWVTHDAAQADRVANRLLRLRSGQLIELESDR